ncbi:mediator complex, subunit Med17 [Limtongia smithiae]|uniref:mediator complex, subunit Med17 n=1 Tax=Limtongia smithiae TaxID=1125753 RepID=UPI0034CDC7EA
MAHDDIFVSLRPPPPPSDGRHAHIRRHLAQIIPQIILERGSFINLTETGLREEIAAQNSAANTPPVSTPATTPDLATLELSAADHAFATARADFTRLVNEAHNELAIALDFVSLLISSARPAAGTTSMSPALKASVPPGSLGADRIRVPADSDAVASPNVALGWKTQAIAAAIARFDASASRLRAELSREQMYWSQVADIAASGEVLSKIRTPDYRGLAVRYGFADAGSEYKEKGVATLRRDDEGRVVLKIMDGHKRAQVLGVRVSRKSAAGGFVDTGFYALTPEGVGLDNGNDANVRDKIKRSRNLLFEEELFFEIASETRALASQGVSLNFGIEVTLALQDYSIVISMVDLADISQMTTAAARPDAAAAEGITVALHLLLSKLHRKNLKKRRSMPPPLGSRTTQGAGSHAEILQPLMTNLSASPSLQEGVSALLKTLIIELQSGQI